MTAARPRRSDPTPYLRSAGVSFGSFLLCLVLLAALPEYYTRIPSSFADASSRFVAQRRGVDDAGAPLNQMGNKLTAGRAKEIEIAKRSHDGLHIPKGNGNAQKIPMQPLRVFIAVLACGSLLMCGIRLVQGLLVAWPRPDPTLDLPGPLPPAS